MTSHEQAYYPGGSTREILVEEILPLLNDFQRRQLLTQIPDEGGYQDDVSSWDAIARMIRCANCGGSLTFKIGTLPVMQESECGKCASVNSITIIEKGSDADWECSVSVTSSTRLARWMIASGLKHDE